jgi:hypothetical protein
MSCHSLLQASCLVTLFSNPWFHLPVYARLFSACGLHLSMFFIIFLNHVLFLCDWFALRVLPKSLKKVHLSITAASNVNGLLELAFSSQLHALMDDFLINCLGYTNSSIRTFLFAEHLSHGLPCFLVGCGMGRSVRQYSCTFKFLRLCQANIPLPCHYILSLSFGCHSF